MASHDCRTQTRSETSESLAAPTDHRGVERVRSASSATAGRIRHLPKILLHTHLEGSIPLRTLVTLSRRNRVHLPFRANRAAIAEACRSGGWQSFASIFSAVASCFRTRRDFHDAVVSYARALAAESVVHVEVHCTPWRHAVRGIPLDVLAAGLVSGAEQAEHSYGIRLSFILDLLRDPLEDATSILAWAKDLPRSRFVAIGISGGPGMVPLAEYSRFTERCRLSGFRVVAHAGELDGPESVRTAIDDLRVDRICHGVRVLEEMDLFNSAVSRGIHFELCPTSNHVLGVGKPEYDSIRGMLTGGANCSINTDDELMFDTSAAKELSLLAGLGIAGLRELSALQRNAAMAAFVDDASRVALARLVDPRRETAPRSTYSAATCT